MKNVSMRMGLDLCGVGLVLFLMGCGDDAAGFDGAGGVAPGSGGGGSGGAGGSSGGGGGEVFSEPLVLDLGDLPSGVPVGFDIPAGALGFHLVAAAPGAGSWGLQRVLDPGGVPVLDDYTPVGGATALSIGYAGWATTTVPANAQSSTIPLMPGGWQLVATGAGATGTAYVQRTSDGQFHGGVLDLHIYIPDGLQIHDPTPMHAITAADAPSDPAVSARVDAFYEAVDAFFGIGRGEVFFHAIGAEHLNVVGEAAYASLVEQSGVSESGQALHVMWAQRIEPVAGYPVWGVSPGAPGIVLETGTRRSAIALALWDTFNAQGDGLTMVHELGHFLGLSHTTELDGIHADPIADTPACEGIDPENLAACPDKTNIMFPAYYGTTGGVGVTVTPTQVTIVRGAPVYRAYASAEAAATATKSAAIAGRTERQPPRAARKIIAGQTTYQCGHSIRSAKAPVATGAP